MGARTLFVAGLGLMALAGCVCGCGGGSAPLPTSAAARQALQVALDAWKAGKPASSLAQLEPKIETVDFEWRAGEALTAYSLGADDLGQGTQTISASLTLKGQRPKDVKYMVFGINPLLIYRAEDFTRAMNMENNPAPSKKRKR
jgi:hypothetical protein